MDLTKCRNKIVIDFGCNLGQTCLKAYQAGAKRVVGIDSQKDTIKLAREIADILKTNIEFYVVDFNHRYYKQKILELLRGDRVDISFFLSMYRTKELKDRDGLFNFIISLTGEVIFFEGHADPGTDTERYYSEVFRNFPINYKFLGYTQGDSRPFYEVYPLK
jgi:SAM-dependent methyltransferase